MALGNLGVKHALGFDGAGGGRHEDWYSGTPRPVNSLTKRDGSKLRERGRDLVRNDLLAVAIANKLSIAISGVRPRSNTGDVELDRAVDALWAEWERQACSSSYMTLSGMVWQIISSWIDSGGAFVRVRNRRPEDGLTVPVQFEPLAIDHLDTSYTTQLQNGSEIIQGIEFDALGRVAAYHLFRRRPGGDFPDTTRVRVPETTCAHLFFGREIGQVRGVPWLSPAMVALRDLQLLGDAQRTRAVGEASLMAFVTTETGEEGATTSGQDSTERDSDGTVIESLEPGLITALPQGKDVKFHTPSARTFDTLETSSKAQIAAASGVTYEQVSGDLSRTNWTSYKAGQIDHRALVRFVQEEIVVPFVLRRLWVWWLDAAVIAGLVPERARRVEKRVPGGKPYVVEYPVQWVLPNFAEVDEQAEAQAKATRVRNGLSTIEDEWRREGRNPAEMWDHLQRQKEEAEKRGLVLDCLPNTTTSSGQVQQTPGAAPPEPARNTRP